jgi:Trypsin-co-occurring domain 1
MREGVAVMQVRVPLENGDGFFIETEVPGDGVVRATRADGAVKSSAETFESSIVRVRHIAEVIVDKLSDLPVTPASIRAEFGVCLTAEAGIGIAKGTGEAHFVIELEWSTKPQP